MGKKSCIRPGLMRCFLSSKKCPLTKFILVHDYWNACSWARGTFRIHKNDAKLPGLIFLGKSIKLAVQLGTVKYRQQHIHNQKQVFIDQGWVTSPHFCVIASKWVTSLYFLPVDYFSGFNLVLNDTIVKPRNIQRITVLLKALSAGRLMRSACLIRARVDSNSRLRNCRDIHRLPS